MNIVFLTILMTAHTVIDITHNILVKGHVQDEPSPAQPNIHITPYDTRAFFDDNDSNDNNFYQTLSSIL